MVRKKYHDETPRKQAKKNTANSHYILILYCEKSKYFYFSPDFLLFKPCNIK